MTARYLAVQALQHQEQNGYANLVLDGELKHCHPPLEHRDAALATGIFYTVLERQNTLDAILGQFLSKPIGRMDAPVRAILRAGLAQIRYMKLPQPAVVNESVKLAKAFGKTSASGMVNAVLRRAATANPDDAHFANDAERLSVLESVSLPVAELLLEQYGEEAFAITDAFFEFAARPTDVRVNTLKTTPDALIQQLQKEGHKAEPGPLPDSLLVKFAGSPAGSVAFKQGLFHVQGQASQIAALSLEAKPGMRVLDLCAAPGGKSLTIAQQMKNKGQLLSCDAVPVRVPLIEKAFVRCGVTCGETKVADAAVYDTARGQFDCVLCDVPCSGLGIIGKKPDIRYKTLENMQQLYSLQADILRCAVRYLAPGGRLVYSTCTVNRHENEEQIEKFCKENKSFAVISPKIVPNGAILSSNGMLLLPNRTKTDGFFVAILQKGTW